MHTASIAGWRPYSHAKARTVCVAAAITLVRERAVRMVGEHLHEYSSQLSAITSIEAKIGCTAESLRRWCMARSAILASERGLAVRT